MENPDTVKNEKVRYVLDQGLLIREWQGNFSEETDWNILRQVVVPSVYRRHVLMLVHDHPWSGHAGITKNYNQILRYFFLASTEERCLGVLLYV